MRKVKIKFPNTQLLSEYLLNNNVSNIEINSTDCTLTGPLDENRVKEAAKYFGIELPVPSRKFEIIW